MQDLHVFSRLVADAESPTQPQSCLQVKMWQRVRGGGSRRALLSERLPRPHWKRLMEDPASRPKDPVTWLDRGRVHR